MNHPKDRRAPRATALFPFRDNTEVAVCGRRKTDQRREEYLDEEERQLLFSEMPAPVLNKPPGDEPG